jgi:hypothetical protein
MADPEGMTATKEIGQPGPVGGLQGRVEVVVGESGFVRAQRDQNDAAQQLLDVEHLRRLHQVVKLLLILYL